MRFLKYAGWLFTVLGLLGFKVPLVDSLSLEPQEPNREFAESVSGTLGPATLGCLSVFIGLVIIFLFWIRTKKLKPMNINSVSKQCELSIFRVTLTIKLRVSIRCSDNSRTQNKLISQNTSFMSPKLLIAFLFFPLCFLQAIPKVADQT